MVAACLSDIMSYECQIQPLSCCRRFKDDHPALQFTEQEFNELFCKFCWRKNLDWSHLQMIQEYIGNMTERQPGLVLHMLNVLDVLNNQVDKPADYMARAQAMYHDQTFMGSLENIPSFLR